MLGLRNQDGARNGKVLLAGDQGSTAEVSAGANALQNGREGDEAGDIFVGERVLTCLHGLLSRGLDGRAEDLNMRLLIRGYVTKIVVVVGGVAWPKSAEKVMQTTPRTC